MLIEARLQKVDNPPGADLIKAPIFEQWEGNSESNRKHLGKSEQILRNRKHIEKSEKY